MKMHVAKLTKQRLSDFFVKEDGHVAHKNALVAGTVASGAILASLMLTPDASACDQVQCGRFETCSVPNEVCCSEAINSDHPVYWCSDADIGC